MGLGDGGTSLILAVITIIGLGIAITVLALLFTFPALLYWRAAKINPYAKVLLIPGLINAVIGINMIIVVSQNLQNGVNFRSNGGDTMLLVAFGVDIAGLFIMLYLRQRRA